MIAGGRLLSRVLSRHAYSARFLVSATDPSTSAAEKSIDRTETLRRFVVDKIRVNGPISLYEYMKITTGGAAGYYGSERQIFGTGGDFVTAPELGQLFGELVTLWLAHELECTGHQGPVQLIECGPGRGFLAADLLRTWKRLEVANEFEVSLVETSPSLIDQQRETICGHESKFVPVEKDALYTHESLTDSGVRVRWYQNIDDLPDKFGLWIANEWLDALPIHQFHRTADGKGWCELLVDAEKATKSLKFVLSRGETLMSRTLVTDEIRGDQDRKVFEGSPDVCTAVSQIADRLIAHGGVALLVDYGHSGDRKTASLRGYSQHMQVDDLLVRPGGIDLTADVDFGILKNLVGSHVLFYGPVPQRNFLAELGAGRRLMRLLESCKEHKEKQRALLEGYRILMDDMGSRFQVIAMLPNTMTEIMQHRGGKPAGFHATDRLNELKKKAETVEEK